VTFLGFFVLNQKKGESPAERNDELKWKMYNVLYNMELLEIIDATGKSRDKIGVGILVAYSKSKF